MKAKKKDPANETTEQKESKDDPTRKEFKGGLPRKAWGLALLPVVISILLILRGLEAHQRFGMNDASRWVFIVPPILLGIGIVVVMVLTAVHNVGKRVIIARSGLTYIDGDEKFVAPWGTLAYSPPQKGRFMLWRTLMLSDGVKFGQIYEIFSPHFAALVQEVEARKGYASTSTRFKMG